MAGNVVVRDLGWRRIKTEVRQLHGRGVRVGLLASSGSSGGVAVVDIAVFNELGTQHIPARPFLRNAVDRNEKAVAPLAKSLAGAVVAGRLTADQVLDRLGLWMQDKIQDSIRTAFQWAAPNAPSTIRKKGSSKPLIDKGVLLRSVSYEKERT